MILDPRGRQGTGDWMRIRSGDHSPNGGIVNAKIWVARTGGEGEPHATYHALWDRKTGSVRQVSQVDVTSVSRADKAAHTVGWATGPLKAHRQ